MSGEQLDQTAPRLAQARNPLIVSGMFGMNEATRSPGPTPISRSPAAIAATSRSSATQLISAGGRVSERTMSAGRSGDAQRNAGSAYLRRAPSNHFAPGIFRASSTREYGAEARISKNSQRDAQKSSRCSTDQRDRKSVV